MLRRLFARGQRAQTLIEFALITPAIILFIVVIVDGAIAFDRRITLQHAVREGARFAAVNTSEANIKQRVVDQAQGVIDTTEVDVCYEDGDDANAIPGNVGDSVRVSVDFTYDFTIIGPVLSGLFGGTAGSVDLTPSGTARLEKSVAGATAC